MGVTLPEQKLFDWGILEDVTAETSILKFFIPFRSAG
jgi:hypothetical protein